MMGVDRVGTVVRLHLAHVQKNVVVVSSAGTSALLLFHIVPRAAERVEDVGKSVLLRSVHVQNTVVSKS